MLDKAKIEAAARAVPLTRGRLIDRSAGTTCYCVVGALLHGAGVPDAKLEYLDHEYGNGIYYGATSFDVCESNELIDRLCAAYGDHITDVLDELESANDGRITEEDVSPAAVLNRVLTKLQEVAVA